MSVRIKDNLPSFTRSLKNVLDDACRTTTNDILIKARTRAPYRKGDLRKNSISEKRSTLHWQVRFWIEYARFQEKGGTAKRQVRHYTSPGTGAHYLEKSGDEMAKKFSSTVRTQCLRARA